MGGVKKAVLSFLLVLGVSSAFGLDNEMPSVLIETNVGYAIGVNLPHAMPVELKLVYPISRFGFTVEGGASFFYEEAPGYHLFLGPTFFVINNPKIRAPISIGLDIVGNKNNSYWGIGGLVSFNYSIRKNIYVGINLEINYDFNNPYEETVGYKDAAIGIDQEGKKIYLLDPHGDPIKYTLVKENKNHLGNNLYIKPTLGIGWQF
ncbi:MAG: hypothetical protein LBG76_07575 [Treponema sp.]|jgi:hypothetical protein|nr:hypothetical protein [Treponema sp.]